MSHNVDNIYLPKLARIAHIKEEIGGERAIKTFRLEFVNGDGFDHAPGQCAMLSIFGRGESMISIASSPLVKEYKQFSIMRVGRVTTTFHELQVGDVVGIRGPYGNQFPMDDWKGKNLVVIGGGVGLAPVWPIVTTALARRADYKNISVFYGARSSRDIMYREDLEKIRGQATVNLSIDKAEDGWKEFVGFVPSNVLDKKPSPDNTVAIVCGPPIMIKFVIQNLQQLGFKDEQIYTTIENKMKCGLGKCGRCNVGTDYVCVKGPVYSWAELKRLPQEY
ncbi:MAG: FAD/NAD(P)-binding protein [Candidatus Nitricoxidivorans perseverans]|uniref:FAD/NAD(P)-binding protein n=1 Tax=Candidatus Nitricoxidivorans perseverans TaxID=2975601 RepID=A0AA49IXZ6_9PROT|nr:MAG: FAD/NAD(P)-binding protein [Candidatus Nitricoxidivorans perseverans]